MKIQNQSNNINFKSAPIRHVNVRNAENGLVEVVLSKLNPHDAHDRKAINLISESLTRKDFTGREFCRNFLNPSLSHYHYNAIELKGEKDLSERILGVVNFYAVDKERMHLSQMFVKPEMQAQNKKRTVKNLGEVFLGELFKKTSRMKIGKIDFISAKDEFYKHIFKKVGVNLVSEGKLDLQTGKCVLSHDDIEKYLNYYTKTYCKKN